MKQIKICGFSESDIRGDEIIEDLQVNSGSNTKKDNTSEEDIFYESDVIGDEMKEDLQVNSGSDTKKDNTSEEDMLVKGAQKF